MTTEREYKDIIEQMAAKIGKSGLIKNNIMKNKFDLKIIIALIAYAVIIGIAVGFSQKSTNDNTRDVEVLKTQSMESRLQIKGLSTRMEFMIELQKEMNKDIKEINK